MKYSERFTTTSAAMIRVKAITIDPREKNYLERELVAQAPVVSSIACISAT